MSDHEKFSPSIECGKIVRLGGKGDLGGKNVLGVGTPSSDGRKYVIPGLVTIRFPILRK